MEIQKILDTQNSNSRLSLYHAHLQFMIGRIAHGLPQPPLPPFCVTLGRTCPAPTCPAMSFGQKDRR